MNIYGRCCEPIEEYYGEISSEPFPPVILNLEGSKFEFLPNKNYGEYELKLKNKSVISTQSNLNKDKLRAIYNDNQKEIHDLNNKIEEIEQKIKTMEKILKIDANEKAYVEEEGIKLNKSYVTQNLINTVEKE